MEHWIEPQAYAPESPPGVQHYVNRPGQLSGPGDAFTLPNQAPTGVQHYVNRPGQLGNIFSSMYSGAKSYLPSVLVGAALGYFFHGQIKKVLKKVSN